MGKSYFLINNLHWNQLLMLFSPASLTPQVPHTSLIVFCRWQPGIIMLLVWEVHECQNVGNFYAEYRIPDVGLQSAHFKGSRAEGSDSRLLVRSPTPPPYFLLLDKVRELEGSPRKGICFNQFLSPKLLSFVCKK